MKIVWVDKPLQDKNTSNPQLIDGKLYYWNVKAMKLRYNSIQEEISQWHQYGKNLDVKYFLIYDVKSINKLFCDQGCKPNQPGCRSKYIEDNHALMIRCYLIKEDTDEN